MRAKIEKTGMNGEGLAYLNRKPFFIPNALVDELIEVEIVEEKEKYAFGKVLRVVEPNPHRIVSPCSYQEECGACALMQADMTYQKQVKIAHLKQALLKYMGPVDFKLIKPIVDNPNPLHYRNQCKVPVAENHGRLMGGMFSAKSNTFVPIETCIVHETDVEAMKHAILRVLNKHHMPEFSRSGNNGIRYILLRSFKQQVQCTLVTGDETLNPRLIDDLMELEGLVSLYHSINSDRHSHEALGKDIFHIAGDPNLIIYINAIKYQLSPKAFFQLNLAQATNIFRKVRNLVNEGETVMDAYCGVGALSLQLTNKVKQVIGVENNRFAIRNAKENALLNKIENIQFICEDAAVALLAYEEALDVLIVDPPRSGLDDEMCAAILSKQIPHVIYVSCNPTSLAKNLSELKKGYTINSITPYDLFSQTPLLECVVDLVLNQSV